MFPMHINIVALNKAWVIRWNVVKVLMLSLEVIIMNATCLSVDRAIIFFRSVSHMAETLAVIEVSVAETISRFSVSG